MVAVVSPSETKLFQLRKAIAAALGTDLLTQVSFFTPNRFIEHLASLPKANVHFSPKETVRRGYKVKRTAPNLTPEELKAKEAAPLKMLADSMKKPKKNCQ